MTAELSPWAKRFVDLGKPQVIKARCEISAQPLYELNSHTAEAACDLLKAELERVFVLTDSGLKVLMMLVDRAASHSMTHYPDERYFLGRCYGQLPEDFESAPVFFTGLAGIGKTQLRRAFFRLLPPDSEVPIPNHGMMPMSAARLIVVKSRKSVLDIYKTLARPGLEAKKLNGETAWLRECQKWLYQCGVCSVLSDELQFLTQGEKANTLLAQVLMGMSYLGPPVSFNGNFSLMHRLLRRPQEEQQRLLTRVHVLHPDSFESTAWLSVLQEFQAAAPGIFSFRLEEESRALWNLTAGIKRSLTHLLILAYRQVRNKVGYSVSMDDVNAAYHSIEFFTQRRDVELLFAYGHRGVSGRMDLSCPFPISTAEAEIYSDALSNARQKKVAEAVVHAVMTKSEQGSLKALQAAVGPKGISAPTGKVLRLRPPSSRTLQSLKQAAEQFKDNKK